MPKRNKSPYILWFEEITMEDIPLVGGKNASLGEITKFLIKKGVEVPPGFAITTHAYKTILKKSGVDLVIKEALETLNVNENESLSRAGLQIRESILSAEFPRDLKEEILKAYQELSKRSQRKHADLAVRSSATAEDLPEASFAGQQESFLNIKGDVALLDACKKCFASLFTNRVIAYRNAQKIDHLKVALSVGVQQMVRSDLASAGVIFTVDTETGFKDVVFITGSFGLGESVVQGAVNPDEYYVFKPTFKKGYKALIDKRLGDKATKMIYAEGGPYPIKKVDTPESDRRTFCLADEEVFQLAKWAILVEEHYSKKAGKWVPMDLEWAKDGKSGKLYIVQARPETVQSQKKENVLEEYRLEKKGKILCTGKSVGGKISCGKAHVIQDVKNIAQFKGGEILVTEMTDPDWVPIMRKAKAIITNRGGRTSHAAIVSRELGLPCIVGTNDATACIQTGDEVTVSCAEGEKGTIYEGILPFKVIKTDIQNVPRPKTKIMVNVGYPDEAMALSFLPNDGVGLAREEFIINEYIRIHPMALVEFDKVKDEETRKEIERLTYGYADKKSFFVDKLAMGVGIIAASFYPKDVILRFSDFKTNEYYNLIGGKYFEPKEQNPMIGWRGASRYYKPGYVAGFALECMAIRKAREEFGLTNIKVMIPVCRTPEEGKKVLQVMKKHGLERGKEGLDVYVMCEIPSNVILADQFCEIFDGFSIGSNDLTQLTLGIDRDSELIADLYNERSEAVKRMIALVIGVAKKNKKKIGICGDAPSTFPEFAEFLVDCGIDSISLSPDAVLKTRVRLSEYEKERKKRK